MPFVSKAQSRLCYSLRERAVKEGKKPLWNCEEWSSKTDYKHLPERKNSKDKIYTGPRGGKYYLKGGRKIYIKS